MTEQTTLPLHVLLAGADRLSTLLPPMLHALGRGLSASGSGRVRFLPKDAESADAYTHQIVDLAALTTALTSLDGVVVLVGHGQDPDSTRPDGDDLDWALNMRSDRRSMAEIQRVIPSRAIKADLLIIDSCSADRTRNIWRNLLHDDGVLLTGRGDIGIQAASQWLTALLSTAANVTGGCRPTKAQWTGVFPVVQESLRSYEKFGGARPRKRPRLADAFVITV